MSEPTDPRSGPCAHPARELLDFHLNGTLSPEEEALVRAHLETCAACAGEIRQLAEITRSLQKEGIEPSPIAIRPRRRWRLHALAAVLLLAVALGLYVARLRPGPAMPPAAASLPVEASLDLGRGATRGAAEPPRLTVTPALRSIRLTLSPPIGPGYRYAAGLCAAGGTPPTETPLGPIDPTGHATVTFPLDAAVPSGPFELVLRVSDESGETRIFRYPFELVRVDDRP